MKNLMVYLNPDKRFNSRFNEGDTLVKIQIDNSLALGWKPEDILLFTNFPYEYNGVYATVLDDSLFCDYRPLSTKTMVVAHMLEQGLVEKGEVYWAHDFDAFQLENFGEFSTDVAAFTDYGWSRKWSLGSYFFTHRALELFKSISSTVKENKIEDERAFVHLTKSNKVKNVEKLNITYNFGMRFVEENYKEAIKPIKVLHFHPQYGRDTKLAVSPLNMFMYGKNPMGVPLMPEHLIKIFNYHGIK